MAGAYIASLDVGTTSIRCYIFDSNCNVRGRASQHVELSTPHPGFYEINPENLWCCVKNVISNAIKDAQVVPGQISCLGLSTQRCSFLTWDKYTDEYFHNIITWKDVRAASLIKKWNDSWMLKVINYVSYALYLITRSKRFLAGSVVKMMNTQVTLRLKWQINHSEGLRLAIQERRALFGTLDTWLLYKLKKGNRKEFTFEHISDVTSCTATGLYDPFTLSWAKWAFGLFSLKEEMFPKVVDNLYNFGDIHESIFGVPIKIGSSLSDQSAAMWGSNCFQEGDVKVTLGTGSFLNVNTGSTCYASICGLYPLVAWKFKSNTMGINPLVFCMEGQANDTGTIIEWAKNLGFYDDPTKSSEIAESAEDVDDVYFIPAFSGLGPPVNDHEAAAGFLGINPRTTKSQLVRALLESIVFSVAQICQCMIAETSYALNVIRVDGGVSKNNFVCQMLANITGLRVERSTNTESSVLGAAFCAGINAKLWSISDVKRLRKIDRIFVPHLECKAMAILKMRNWEKAVERFKGWYSS